MEKAVLRKLTILCVICGAACFALWGVMAIRDGKREWKPYQAGYKALLLGMIGRDSNPALYRRVAEMQPEIKQVVIEEWQAVDRCTTCHLGIEDPLFAGAKQPFTTHPYPQLLKQHPVEKFGCTICHGGQGRSTTYRGAAHRTIAHWPDPMVEKGLIQSRCGICHKEFEAIGADKLIEGRQLFKEMHCAGCHRIERVGGDVGPVLSAFADKDPGNFSYANIDGVRSKQNWVREHFKNPQKITPDSPMRPYPMSEQQIECLASYVLSLSQRVFPRSFTPKAGGEPSRVDTAIEKATASSKAKGENP